MEVSMRDKKILLMFIGILVFFVGWYFGYRPQMEKADQIEDLNRTWRSSCRICLSLQQIRISM